MSSTFKRLLILLLLIVLSGFGIALTIKADIGIGSVNALSLTFSYISPLSVGTWVMLVNCSAVIVQVILKGLKWPLLAQFALVFLLGKVIDFFHYLVLSDLNWESYWISILVFLLGNTICAIGIGLILHLDMVVFPVEGACQLLANRYDVSFFKIRFSLDFLVIVLTLCVTYLYQLPLTIREGTILSFILFSKNVDMTLIYAKRHRVFNRL